MKFLRLVARLALLGTVFAAHAAAGDSVTSVIVVPSETTRTTAIGLMQPADFLCATVEISSREKDPSRQAEAVRAALRALQAAVEKAPRLQLHRGPMRFHTMREKSYALSSYASSVDLASLASSVRILYKLDGRDDDVFAGAVALRKLIEEQKASAPIELRLSQITVAVESPERQRERLLSLIRESADAMRAKFKAEQVTIAGLDGPVLVRQVDGATVELFIDFQMTVVGGD
jgi:hypothetical protein